MHLYACIMHVCVFCAHGLPTRSTISLLSKESHVHTLKRTHSGSIRTVVLRQRPQQRTKHTRYTRTHVHTHTHTCIIDSTHTQWRHSGRGISAEASTTGLLTANGRVTTSVLPGADTHVCMCACACAHRHCR